MTIKKYQNKDWLFNQYWDKELSQKQIRELCETTRFTIRYWLKKFNISQRSYSESVHLARANHCKLSQKAIEWINGELLGDGCLTTTSKENNLPSENLSVLFRYSSKYKEYINYISRTLESFGIKQSGKIIKQYNRKQKNYCYKYNSHSYKELMFIYEKWYPKGKKIIPRDIELTPVTLRQHYIGDGSLIHQKGNTRIIICTHGFSIFGVNQLIKRLINLGFKAMRQPSSNAIYISTYSVKYFLNFIGKCPVNCYQYKWEY